MIFLVERRKSTQHLVEEHTERPPIYGAGVALAFDEFGREVFGRAGEG